MSNSLKSRPARGASQRVRTKNRTLCDAQVPACTNCHRNGIACLVEDPATKRHQPRNYLETLEQRIAFLEDMLREVHSNPTAGLADSSTGQFTDSDHRAGHLNVPMDNDEDDEVNNLSSVIGALNLNAAGAEPHYLGPSSAFAFSRFIEPSLREAVSTMSTRISNQGFVDMTTPEPCALPDYRTAQKLSTTYFQNIHPQYPFLHESTFRQWEAALEDPFQTMSNLSHSPVPLYFLNMVYAIGALLLSDSGYSPERLYVSALLYIDAVLCQDNLESIQAILCCAAYSLRSSKGMSHWKLAGQALRQCVNLGYHRNYKRLRPSVNPLQLELQKRTFWSAYEMECSAAVMLGRPLSLHFQEIDAEFPLDIDDSCITEAAICGSPRTSPTDPPTMMSYAIHAFRIRALHGQIQTSLYSDTTLKDPEVRNSRVRELQIELDKCQALEPPSIVPPPGGALSFFVTSDWFQVSYNFAVLQLYRVQITDKKDTAPDEIFLKCLHAAKSTCHGFRRQLFGKPTTYTWGALHELFLAGLTYLYCLWVSPAARSASRQDQVSSTCTDCTILLVILAERWSDAVPYRDVFETLASSTMTMMANKRQEENAIATTLLPCQEQYAESLPQWMAEIADTGISLGVDLLLGELIYECPFQENEVSGPSVEDNIDEGTLSSGV